jgi:hypothetical protein
LASIKYHADFTIIFLDTPGEEQSDEQQAAEKPIGIEEQKTINKNHGIYTLFMLNMLECIYNLVLLAGYARKHFARSNELKEVKQTNGPIY